MWTKLQTSHCFKARIQFIVLRPCQPLCLVPQNQSGVDTAYSLKFISYAEKNKTLTLLL